MRSRSATVSRSVDHGGVSVPTFLYGTAWKEDRTERLTRLALACGFRGIDTANQRKHYFEAAVGRAVAAAIDEGELTRADLFLQTKFTHRSGQDHRLPYDPKAPLATQVRQSVASSLAHLAADYLDSYLLHGPSAWDDLADADWQVWSAMEELYDAGTLRLLGISNVSADQLRTLCAHARVRPAFVQNRCYASRGWDAEVRAVCREHGILYQGFSLLTANARELNQPTVRRIARRHRRSTAQVAFRAALELGLLALTGTSSREHMAQDLSVYDFELEEDEVRAIEASR